MNKDAFSLRTVQNSKALVQVAIADGIKTTEDLTIWLDNHIQKENLIVLRENRKENRRSDEEIELAHEGRISDNGKFKPKTSKERKKQDTRGRKYEAVVVRTFPSCPDCGQQLWPEFMVDENLGASVMVLKCNKKCRFSQYEGTREQTTEKYSEFYKALDEILEANATGDIR